MECRYGLIAYPETDCQLALNVMMKHQLDMCIKIYLYVSDITLFIYLYLYISTYKFKRVQIPWRNAIYTRVTRLPKP